MICKKNRIKISKEGIEIVCYDNQHELNMLMFNCPDCENKNCPIKKKIYGGIKE